MSTGLKKVEALPVVELEVKDEMISGLRAQTQGLVADTPANYELVKQSLAECRRLKRIATDNKKQLKARALAWGRAVDSEYNRVVGLIEEIADPLKETKKEADEAKERALRAQEEKERLKREAKEKAEREAREAAERAERERIEKERAAEQKRIEEENLRLQKELAEARAREEKERAEREKAEREMRRRQEEAEAKERAERERKEAAKRAELEAKEKAEREKADAAERERRRPDAEKLLDFANLICCVVDGDADLEDRTITLPSEMSTEWGADVLESARSLLLEISNMIKNSVKCV